MFAKYLSHIFTLTVTGQSATDECIVNVTAQKAVKHDPKNSQIQTRPADAGEDQTVKQGAQVTLTAQATIAGDDQIES
ncbi:MAG: hypothetical protein GY874_06970 [Desulfobacteraceae bacterium]|nr:hypothetical protein [Desulfobacteraceae bacterium]